MQTLLHRHADGTYTVSGPHGVVRYEPLLGKGSLQAADGNWLWEYLPARAGDAARDALDAGEEALWPLLEAWYYDHLDA